MDGTIQILKNDDYIIKTKKGYGIIVMYGLLKGNIHDMRKKIDVVMHQVNCNEKVECIILTSYPSFRIPDAVLRYCFTHAKQYSEKIENIYFVDLPIIKKAVFNTICRALPESLSRLIKLIPSSSLCDILGDVTIPHYSDLISSGSCENMYEDDILIFDGRKIGNGGTWGNKKWKNKTFHVSKNYFWYVDKSDSRLVSTYISLSDCIVFDKDEKNNILTIKTNDKFIKINADIEVLNNFSIFFQKTVT